MFGWHCIGLSTIQGIDRSHVGTRILQALWHAWNLSLGLLLPSQPWQNWPTTGFTTGWACPLPLMGQSLQCMEENWQDSCHVACGLYFQQVQSHDHICSYFYNELQNQSYYKFGIYFDWKGNKIVKLNLFYIKDGVTEPLICFENKQNDF